MIARVRIANKVQKSTGALASSLPVQNLKFQREDWSLFRTIEGLQQRAGPPRIWRCLCNDFLDSDGRAWLVAPHKDRAAQLSQSSSNRGVQNLTDQKTSTAQDSSS
jgi:hypothetical protein